MKELKCPHCGKIFTTDEAGYAAILSQVKNAEFSEEVNRRIEELLTNERNRQQIADSKAREEYTKKLAAKDLELEKKGAEIDRIRTELQSEINNKEVEKKEALANERNEFNKQIAELNSKLANTDKERDLAIAREREVLNEQIAELNIRLANSNAEKENAILQHQNETNEEINRLKSVISEKENELKDAARDHDHVVEELKRAHDKDLRHMEEQIEQLKDFKMRLSTKMIGESLEQHCQNTFNSVRSMAYPSAYFDKDNDASEGSKGDFIFRDFVEIDGKMEEYISIMFEMKNEMDTTATKHKNEDFFAKLDKDRNDKHCEYAVLVSMLEKESELYNEGIVDVSYKYEKMFVVRPQFFMKIISLLCNAAKGKAITIARLHNDLDLARTQSIDISKFEAKRDKFAEDFKGYLSSYSKKHDEAIAAIDQAISDAQKQITKLEKIKKLFDTSENKLRKAGDVIENDFTIKKLTHGNPTMKKEFENAKKALGKTPD